MVIWMVGVVGAVAIACGGEGTGSEGLASPPVSESVVSAPATEPNDDMAEAATTPTTAPPDESDESVGGEAIVPIPVGKVVFDSDRSGNLDLYLLEEGSTDPVRLTEDAGSDRVGNLTPDGETVLFSSDRAGGPDSPTGLRRFDLYRLDLVSNQEQHLLGSRTYNSGAVLSPDGETLAFGSDASGENHIYLAGPDGSSPRQVTQENTSNSGPAWSPDGTQIAYSARGEEDWDVWIMDGDGNTRRPLVEGPDDASSPTWSPDGTSIAFHSNREGTMDLFVVEVSTGDVNALTEGSADDRYPSWSPDGQYVAFDSDRHADEPDIYMVNVGDGRVSRLTDDPGRDAFPDWGP